MNKICLYSLYKENNFQSSPTQTPEKKIVRNKKEKDQILPYKVWFPVPHSNPYPEWSAHTDHTFQHPGRIQPL